jgi:hypothetical protein
MRIFIVRPFNVQDGFDFERVDAELIRPALEQLKTEHDIEVFGGPTTEITKQGNIRTDMFRLLVTSDLVIADVSIHNANAFYELGIRHGLRDRHTVLIRARTEQKYPFDLQTDRYLVYDRDNLAAAVAGLTQTLRETLASQDKDSPVFQLLPKLKPHPRAELAPVPLGFQEEVERALNSRDFGRLRLMAHEARSFEWHIEGLRLIGNAQFKLKGYPGAKETFEAMRASDPDDLQANQRLGTIYQRLSKVASAATKPQLLTLSDQRVRRALEIASNRGDRAEAYSLLGSNAKTRWIEAVHSAPPANVHREALGSPWLTQALDAYLDALRQRLDDHYPAINVLALMKCQIELASVLPDLWEAQCNDEQDASNQLQARRRTAERVTAVLELALARDAVLKKPADYNEWAISSEAELLLLTQPNRAARVKQAYRNALEKVDFFTVEATRRNLEVYQYLKFFEPNTSAALEEIAKLNPPADAAPPERLVLFTGHMVDAAERPKEKKRFPRTAEAERIARELISEALLREAANPGGVSLGIAGGACGSDILFHDACEAAGIPAVLMLALPPDQFMTASVQHGNADWVERYRKLCKRLEPRVLQESKALPDWLAEKRGYDIWQRNNLWMMLTALTFHAPNLTLMVLYNPDLDPDGPGGTKHLLNEARQRDFKIIELDARKLIQ